MCNYVTTFEIILAFSVACVINICMHYKYITLHLYLYMYYAGYKESLL